MAARDRRHTDCWCARQELVSHGALAQLEETQMSKVLYIRGSPRGERSHSVTVADAFAEAYKTFHPNDTVSTLDLFRTNLPPFDGLTLQAKYTILHGKQHTPEELQAWKAVEAAIAEFKSADKYVFAVPMWNFGIPYRLKHYLDVIVQPGYTFSYSPTEGFKGLVTGKPVFIAYARGGEYPEGTPGEAFDFQKKYLETILGFMGLSDIRSVVVEPTLLAGPEVGARKTTEALAQAKAIAATF
jgi:FMN-dependent NADH-azoreductase